jgi:hypothetical protein
MGFIHPLGGGAGINDELLVCDAAGTLIRLQVLIDLHRVRPRVGTYFPYYCPVCSHGWPQETPNWQRHTFDYVERLVDGTFLALCCYCGGEWTLYGTFDRTGGVSIGPQVMLKPMTYRKSEEDIQADIQ